MTVNLATEPYSGYTFIFDTDSKVLTVHNDSEAHTFTIPESSYVVSKLYTAKVLDLREAKDFIEGEFSRAFGLSHSPYAYAHAMVDHKVKLIKALRDAVTIQIPTYCLTPTFTINAYTRKIPLSQIVNYFYTHNTAIDMDS